ncbi:MAG TPA: YihY/virulence factor BrkB family protein [Stellaceae bacterium]|nr:YihY/virulence factor BrkB family protein [Stellaceae bacterium]
MPDGGDVHRLGARIARAIARRGEGLTAGGTGWWTILREVGDEIGRHNVAMMAAALAFYALLSLFPGLSALISLYGLVANPSGVRSLLSSLGGILPHAAVTLLSQQLLALINAGHAKLGLAFLASVALAVWSAMSGTGVLMQALTLAHDRVEDRGFLEFYLIAAALTAGLIVFGCFSLLFVIVVPAALQTHALPHLWREAVTLARWPMLAGLGIVGLAIVYRFAPRRRNGEFKYVTPGAVLATLLWIIASAGFSLYVARFGSYDRTYGSLGAAVVLLLWLYLTAFIILAGAELDCVLESRRRARSWAGKRSGRRRW